MRWVFLLHWIDRIYKIHCIAFPLIKPYLPLTQLTPIISLWSHMSIHLYMRGWDGLVFWFLLYYLLSFFTSKSFHFSTYFHTRFFFSLSLSLSGIPSHDFITSILSRGKFQNGYPPLSYFFMWNLFGGLTLKWAFLFFQIYVAYTYPEALYTGHITMLEMLGFVL